MQGLNGFRPFAQLLRISQAGLQPGRSPVENLSELRLDPRTILA
ncbi:MAG: hypothetical protein AAGD10_15415 [Myxococcota bacterium]